MIKVDIKSMSRGNHILTVIVQKKNKVNRDEVESMGIQIPEYKDTRKPRTVS